MITTYSAPDIECDGCANAIRKSLGALPGVRRIDVDVPAKTVAVSHEDDCGSDRIVAALDRAGFPATELTNGKE